MLGGRTLGLYGQDKKLAFHKREQILVEHFIAKMTKPGLGFASNAGADKGWPQVIAEMAGALN